jgi:hypothetical protein
LVAATLRTPGNHGFGEYLRNTYRKTPSHIPLFSEKFSLTAWGTFQRAVGRNDQNP